MEVERQTMATEDTPPAFPICPSLKTQWVRLGLATGLTSGDPISVGSTDGSLWRSGHYNTDLWRYDETPIGGIWLPVWSGSVHSLSARSATEVQGIFVTNRGSGCWMGTISDKGETNQLPDLPSGHTPGKLSAASDDTLWVQSEEGGLFQYEAGTKSWTAIETTGHTISTLSVGSRYNIWGLEFTENGTVTLQYDDAGGWKVVEIAAHKNMFWIGACADGAVWSGSISKVMLRRPGSQSWESYDNPGLMASFAAGSAHGVLGFGGVYSSSRLYFGVLRAGIVDEPGVNWPVQTSGQEAAYSAISTRLGISNQTGVRGEYTNEISPFSDWHGDVQQMSCPTGIAPGDFEVVQRQIATELEYVTTVYNLFREINDLNANLQIVNNDVLPAVAGLVGLTETPEDKHRVINAVLNAVFQGVINKLIGMIPFPGNLAVGLTYAGFKAGVDAATHGPKPPDHALPIQYARLAETLADIYVEAEKANSQYKQAILTDWGRLKAFHVGNFKWPTTQSAEIAARAKPSFELSFYQMLMPAKWQIVHMAAWPVNMTGRPPPTCDPSSIPSHVSYLEYLGDDKGWLLYEVWFCNKLGLPSKGCSGWKSGPFPAKPLMDRIANIEGIFVDMRDFYKGENGWELTRIER